MSMFESGKYFITSLSGKRIGRYWLEDMSLNPKQIILLPNDDSGNQAKRPDDWSPEWVLEKQENGFILKTDGAYTAPIDNNIFAILLDSIAPPTEWSIIPIPQHGRNVYSIITKDNGHGWVAPDDNAMTQIVYRPHIVGLSHPPTYPSGQLFKIISVDEKLDDTD